MILGVQNLSYKHIDLLCCEVAALIFKIISFVLDNQLLGDKQVNIALWPRFKMVFDMHLSSLRNVNIRNLWEDDVHPHYVMRRYAEFTASLIHLNVEYGDGQVRQLLYFH